VTDRDGTEHLRPGADDHPVADRGVPLAVGHRASTEGGAVEEGDVVTDDRRLTDDDTHAVVDEQPTADGRRRVDLDACRRARRLREQPGREAQGRVAPHPVGHPVRPDGVDPGVGQGDLERAAGGRVAVACDLEVFAEQRPGGGEA
jgi:hypothetical protein